MIIVISPAKALNYVDKAHIKTHSQPLFTPQAQELIAVLSEKSPLEIAKLMTLSDKLAALNVARYAAWSPEFTKENAKQAVLAFDGDVYGGLEAKSLSKVQLDWAQKHLRILSGLYGVLRPLDLMQPYRLEMGTALATAKGANLYQFWGATIADYLRGELASSEHKGDKVLLNLASQEYFKSVDTNALGVPVVECVFEEYKEGKFKIISFFAKRARGLMARYVIENKITKLEKLKDFDYDGYVFAPEASNSARLVFRRGEV